MNVPRFPASADGLLDYLCQTRLGKEVEEPSEVVRTPFPLNGAQLAMVEVPDTDVVTVRTRLASRRTHAARSLRLCGMAPKVGNAQLT